MKCLNKTFNKQHLEKLQSLEHELVASNGRSRLTVRLNGGIPRKASTCPRPDTEGSARRPLQHGRRRARTFDY